MVFLWCSHTTQHNYTSSTVTTFTAHKTTTSSLYNYPLSSAASAESGEGVTLGEGGDMEMDFIRHRRHSVSERFPHCRRHCVIKGQTDNGTSGARPQGRVIKRLRALGDGSSDASSLHIVSLYLCCVQNTSLVLCIKTCLTPNLQTGSSPCADQMSTG